jgi:precorrin-2 dehydrogenase/sirohydrochlorin ferrochelatase
VLPVTLDLARLPVVLVGNGARAAQRLLLLDEAGVRDLAVFAPNPAEALAYQAGRRLHRRWPEAREIFKARLLLIADGVDLDVIEDMIKAARAAGTLVHVEDRPALSDFHSPALVRRGDLLIAVSTGGRSPALARRLARFLGNAFGPEWRDRVEELGRLRKRWREIGVEAAEISARTEAWLDREGTWPHMRAATSPAPLVRTPSDA